MFYAKIGIGWPKKRLKLTSIKNRFVTQLLNFFILKRGLFDQDVCKFQQIIIQGVQKIGPKIIN